MTTLENSASPLDRLSQIRAAMKPLGALLDSDDISEKDYQDAEARSRGELLSWMFFVSSGVGI